MSSRATPAGAFENPFAWRASQREPQREVVEVDRRRHHDGVRNGIEYQRDGQLFNDVIDGRDRLVTLVTKPQQDPGTSKKTYFAQRRLFRRRNLTTDLAIRVVLRVDIDV